MNKLVQKLERDEDGKPILHLKFMEQKVISTPKEEKYEELMRVLECGGEFWVDGDFPTNNSIFEIFRKNTCIECNKGFHFDNKSYFKSQGLKIISTQEFYDIQEPPITPDMIEEINDWFNKQNY